MKPEIKPIAATPTASGQSRQAPISFFGRWPPICPGATPPVLRNRATQAIAVLTPTPKRAAAWRQD